jgi:rhodanese-related sulfurtransferase
MNVAMNKKGYESFEKVLHNGMRALSVADFERIAEETGALILDTRNNGDFYKAFIPQSINIGINGDFAPWVGAMIADVQQPILLVTELEKEEETVTRLSRVGFDQILGHLEGGFESWVKANKEIDTINRITPAVFEEKLNTANDLIIDIRKESEYSAEHVAEAYNKPLSAINDWITTIDPKQHFYMHCAGGYRSMIAASILQARGFRNFTEIEGGFNAIAKTAVPKTDFVCQSKVLK